MTETVRVYWPLPEFCLVELRISANDGDILELAAGSVRPQHLLRSNEALAEYATGYRVQVRNLGQPWGGIDRD